MTTPIITEDLIYITTEADAFKYLQGSESITGARTRNQWLIYWFAGAVLIAVILYAGYLSNQAAIPLHRQKSTE